MPRSVTEDHHFRRRVAHDRPTAPCVFDGPINGKKFRAYVGQILVPTLGAGDLEVMDNLASHEVASIVGEHQL